MARKASFKVTNTRRGWKVEIPASFSPNGERTRSFFKTQDEAKEAASRFRNQQEAHGRAAALIRPGLAEDAIRAAILLEPYGLSVLEAARRIANMEEAARRSSVVEAAFEMFLAAKEGRSDSQERTYSHLAAGMKEDFSGRSLSTITGADLLNEPEPPEDLPAWPENGLRHTHASVHIALGKPLESLTFEFGHSGGAQVLKSHYMGTMPKAEAASIWALGPRETTLPLD